MVGAEDAHEGHEVGVVVEEVQGAVVAGDQEGQEAVEVDGVLEAVGHPREECHEAGREVSHLEVHGAEDDDGGDACDA